MYDYKKSIIYESRNEKLREMDRTPRSCDTFVALPPATAGDYVVFGKNSDRPFKEVQEVVHFPAADHESGSKVECTYIEIDQAPHTYAVVLSRPSWLWGAEMGANEHGVCIGNEAVWTKLNGADDAEERLLGMDLVRLGLERGKTAREALDVITSLLEKHGQGGNCAEGKGSWSYHNSFLLADGTEAWVLETAAKFWAAEKITEGVRNISNQLTIRTKIDLMSVGLKEYAETKGWWSPSGGDFDFSKALSDSFEESELIAGHRPEGRQQCGRQLLLSLSEGGKFTASDMMKILRDEDSGICMTGAFLTTGSQVSVLSKSEGATPCCHWFTATPNPRESLFKPFIFCANASLGEHTVSPEFGDKDPVKQKPRFEEKVDRRHELYQKHEKVASLLSDDSKGGAELLEQMRELETLCIGDIEDILKNFDERSAMRMALIFPHMVELEMNFYK